MNLDKFKYLIKERSLYFARADQFPDPLEGTFPTGSLRLFSALKVKYLEDFISRAKSLCKSVAVNCWHMNDSESLDMWHRYTNNGQGAAIRSTFSRLMKPMSAYATDRIRIVKVHYIAFSKAALPPVLGYPFEYKDVNYKDDKELRCIIYRKNSINGKGIPVPIDLDKLIGAIYISPFAPIHFKDSVREMMAKYGLVKQIFRSRFTEK